ncbi:MAG: hypothetical protein EKK42_32875 [Pseudonocardiaceae bacterium]|nr:MAG: hypothetical protein EKK42_32875 [Pseudonocardiaceae bacterium]
MDYVDEVIHLCRKTGRVDPLFHAMDQGLLVGGDERARVADALHINTGRPRGEFTEADNAWRLKFLDEARAIHRQRGLTGDDERVRVGEEIHPRYEKLPSGKLFLISSAREIARKNCVRGTAQKLTGDKDISGPS